LTRKPTTKNHTSTVLWKPPPYPRLDHPASIAAAALSILPLTRFEIRTRRRDMTAKQVFQTDVDVLDTGVIATAAAATEVDFDDDSKGLANSLRKIGCAEEGPAK